MQPCLNDPMETGYRSFYFQWEFTSMTASIHVLTLPPYNTITTQLAYVITKHQS